VKQFVLSEKQKKQNFLENLNHRIRNCERCRLSATRKHALAGEGNPNAFIMVIALSPGEKEDSENKMFIGPSGYVLDKLFYEAGRLKKKWVELYCKGDWENCIRYKMEEQRNYHPDWMLPDGSLDEDLKEF
jgi:uracil-DNA glycosylase